MMRPQFEVDEEYYGFDKTAAPDWLMVPLNDEKHIFLKNADGMTVTSLNPRIADVKFIDPLIAVGAKGRRAFMIRGDMRGETFIEVRNAKKTLMARLEVAVKRERVVKVAFNFVEDAAGHKTARNPADVEAWMDTLNATYTPQVNVVIVKQSVQWVKVNANLGQVVGVTKPYNPVAGAGEWDAVVAKRDRNAEVNLFFVWEYEQDKTAFHDDAEGAEWNKNCLIEDNTLAEPSGINTIAHEIGHALGVPGESHYYKKQNEDGLMYYASSGYRIGKVHANMMNR